MKIWVGVTEIAWFEYLRQHAPWVEVNHWLTGGSNPLQSLDRHELVLFKLKSPKNVIAGGGFFSHASSLPARLAWDIFGQANGTPDFHAMQEVTQKHSKESNASGYGYEIGSIILRDPFFFHESEWIPTPDDFSPKISHGKTYHTTAPQGRLLYEEVLWRLNARLTQPMLFSDEDLNLEEGSIYDSTILHKRMGPGTFRVLLTEIYQRKCAVTRESLLPVLNATHIVPLSKGGQNRIDNGMLLRSDLQRLFSMGYLTVTPEGQLKTSPKITAEFGANSSYSKLNDKDVWLPKELQQRPKKKFLEWHNTYVFQDE